MSGIINIVTKEGSQKYSGMLRGYVGDYLSNADQFEITKTIHTFQDPVTGAVTQDVDRENPLARFNPTYNAEASLSGPIPGLGDKLTFFLNGRYYETEGHLHGRQWFTPQGNPGDSSLTPMNPHQRKSLQAKLTWKLMPNMKLSYNAFWNTWQNRERLSERQKEFLLKAGCFV